MILPQTGRYLIVIPDGLGTLTPQSASLEFYWATDVTFKFAVVHSDGTPVNMTSRTLQMTFKTRETDTTPLVSRQATITDTPNGLGETYVTSANDRAILVPGSYAVDVIYTDSSGPTAKRDEGLLPSRALVKGTVTQVGDPISVPTFQQPLAQGANGTNGATGATGATGASGVGVPLYTSVAAMRADTINTGTALTSGYAAIGDGGGGQWYWSSASTATDDGATVVKPTSVSSAGRWLRQVDGRRYNVKWWGAKCDGTTDDTTAVNAAITFTQTLTPKGGTIYIPGNCLMHNSQVIAHTTKGVRLLGDGSQVFTSRLAGDRPTSCLIFDTDGTGLPTNNYGKAALIDARSTDGFQLIGLGVLQSSLTYPGVGLDYTHDSSGSDSAQGYVGGCVFSGISFDGVNYQAPAAAAISYAAAIECTVEFTSFYRWQAGIRGQEQISNALAYSNVIEVRKCQFSMVPSCIVNPGQSWRIIGNTAEGLGSATLYCKNFILDDIDDTVSGYSHDLLTVEDNWCGDAFGAQEWIKIRPATNTRICGNLFEGSSAGCIQFFSSYSGPLCEDVTIENNDFSPTSGFWVDFGSNITWVGLRVSGLDYASGNVLNQPNKYGVTVGNSRYAGAAGRPSLEGNSFSPALAPNQMPTSGGGLLAWWKADALSLNDGDLVSTWTDSSGHGWSLTASGSQRPTFKTSIQAGLPVVRFDGVANKMVSADMSLTTACTFLFVFRANGSLVSQDTVIDGSLGVNQARCYRSGIYEMNLGGLTVGVLPTHFGAYAVVATGSTSSSARGGDLVAQGSLANFTTFIHSVVVGMDGAGLHPMAMDLAEIAIFDRYTYPDEIVGALQSQRAKWQCM